MFERQIQQANDMIRRAQLGAKLGFSALSEKDQISYIEEQSWRDGNRHLIIHAFGVQSVDLSQYEAIIANRGYLYEQSRDRKDPHPIFTSAAESYRQIVGFLQALEAKYEAIQAERNPRTEVTMQFGNVSGSIINVDSVLSQVTQSIGVAPAVGQETKRKLTELVEELRSELQKVPAHKREEAEAVADSAKHVVEAGMKANPNKTTVQITAEGLKKAAESVADVMPTILTVASSIIRTVSVLAGFPLP